MTATGSYDTSSHTLLLSLPLVVNQASSSKDFISSDGILHLTTITFIVNVCGQTNPLSVNTFRQKWTNDYGTSSPATGLFTMQDYYKGCSYGKVDFTPTNNVVVGPIDIPCTGVTSWGQSWNALANCGYAEVYGWAQLAEQVRFINWIDI